MACALRRSGVTDSGQVHRLQKPSLTWSTVHATHKNCYHIRTRYR
ncbi:MAG: hypothetical protein P8X89_13670 [Reinekea sp.]